MMIDHFAAKVGSAIMVMADLAPHLVQQYGRAALRIILGLSENAARSGDRLDAEFWRDAEIYVRSELRRASDSTRSYASKIERPS
jgi:hypothetical protein